MIRRRGNRSGGACRGAGAAGFPLVALWAALALALPGQARADHPAQIEGFSSEGEVMWSTEARALGSEHALQHRKPLPGYAERAARRGEITRRNRFTGGPPNRVGRWARAYFKLPFYAIHAAMLPTGKVLFWGYPPPGRRPRDGGNYGQAALWDPARGTGRRSIERVPPPVIDPDGRGYLGRTRAPIYCSGQSHLPTGDVLLTGGNLVWPEADEDDPYSAFVGISAVLTFDPFREKWVVQPHMAGGRWYPSQIQLADQRTAIFGGFSAEPPGGIHNPAVEIFEPGPGSGRVGNVSYFGELQTELYPHLYTLPDRKVLVAGPGEEDAYLVDFFGGTPKIEDLGGLPFGQNRIGSNGVPTSANPGGTYESLLLGGYDNQNPVNPGADKSDQKFDAIRRVDGFDAQARDWYPAHWQNLPRSFANTVLLPDGSMVTVGGGNGRTRKEGLYRASQKHKRVEVRGPGGGAWALGPSQREFRTYHSTAVLLPDGRIWSAGDDAHPYTDRNPRGFSRGDTAEIYNPPYMYYRGKRPRIVWGPREVRYGDEFGVGTERGGSRVVLMAPSATTHGADMHQKRIPLQTVGRPSKGVNVRAPASSAVAPEGFYMMFVLRSNGKPSKARWVHLADYHGDAPTIRDRTAR